MKTKLNKNWFKVEEGYVLVSDEELIDGDWFYNTFSDNQAKIQQRKGNWRSCFNQHKIIGSTFPLEGVPMILLEDSDVEGLAHINYPYGSKGNIGSRERSLYEHKKESFIAGYNQAKSKYEVIVDQLL
jgi:hypothetical protein